ncbi:MAG: HEPN domain-containing protein [Candidatus Omnitrophota bacterium]
MNPEFEKCLKRNKIKEFPRGKILAGKDLKTSKEDLNVAEESFVSGKYKWATIQAYYSLFHSARALLFAKNYREKSHYCLIVAIKALYVEPRLLPASVIDMLWKGKRLREDADYYDRWSKEGAEFALKSARKLLKLTENML